MTTLAESAGQHELVDLSLLLDDDLPSTWPGHMPFEHKVHNWYVPVNGPGQRLRSTAPYFTCWMTIDEHAGTHLDAPPHFVPPPGSGLPLADELGAEHVDRVPLDDLLGPAVVVDVTALRGTAEPGRSPRVTVEFVEEWERANGRLAPGDVVLLRAGWDELYRPGAHGSGYVLDPVVHRSAEGWPAPDAHAVVALYERGIVTLGTDCPSIGAVDEGISMHRAGLQRGMRYVEGLAALDALPTRGAYFLFLPLKLARSSAASGRAVAFVPRELARADGRSATEGLSNQLVDRSAG